MMDAQEIAMGMLRELTTLAPNQVVTLSYRRAGYPVVMLRLRGSGEVENPPGHAEFRWEMIDNCTLRFLSNQGEQSALLRAGDGCFRGMLLNRIYSELRDIPTLPPRPPGPMRYILCIPYVNRLDLLTKAVQSVAEAFSGHIILIDNSDDHELRHTSAAKRCEVFLPPVPLTFTQTQNLMQKLARERECDVLFFMHADSEAGPGAAAEFLDQTTQIWKGNPRFGVIFTEYDALCAFNMAAVTEVGPWDTVFTQYYADNDYYTRIEKCGFSKLSVNVSVHHEVSATIKSDPHRAFVNSIFFPVFGSYFKMKHQH